MTHFPIINSEDIILPFRIENIFTNASVSRDWTVSDQFRDWISDIDNESQSNPYFWDDFRVVLCEITDHEMDDTDAEEAICDYIYGLDGQNKSFFIVEIAMPVPNNITYDVQGNATGCSYSWSFYQTVTVQVASLDELGGIISKLSIDMLEKGE